MPATGEPVSEALAKAQQAFRDKVGDAALYDEILDVRTADDLQQNMAKIQHSMAKRGKQCFMGRIGRFLEVLNTYRPTIEVFVQVKPELLALIWGPVSVVLRWASEYQLLFDAVAIAMGTIGDIVPQFDLLAKTFPDRAELGAALVLFYENLLDFYYILLSLARKFKRKLWFNILWPRFRIHLDKVVKNMEDHATLVRSQATVLDIQEARASRLASQASLAGLQSAQDHQQWIGLRAAIAPEFYDERLGWYRSGAVAGCADWLFDDDQFRQWADPSSPQKNGAAAAAWLFLYGIPGAGKTHLAAASVDHIRNTVGEATTERQCGQCCVFFALINHASKVSLTALSVLKSLLFQAAEDDADLKTLLVESKTGDLRGSLPHITDLLKGFLLHETKITTTYYIVIDGLDEMDKRERRLLLRELSVVAQECKDLRIMISSRAEDDIDRVLREQHGATSIRVDNNNHGSIKAYIEHRLRDWVTTNDINREYETEIRQLLDRLPEKANGMFLYARIILDKLEYISSPDEIRTEFGVLPTDLDDAYHRIFQRISNSAPNVRAKCRRILSWIECAPTPLTIYEMGQAILINAADHTKNPPCNVPQVLYADANVVRLCGPIIEVVGGDRLCFVHFTVTGYIFSADVQDSIDRTWAAEELAACLLAYLSSGVLALPEDGDDNAGDDDDADDGDNKKMDRNILAGHYRLLQYAAMHWLTALHPFFVPPAGQNKKQQKQHKLPMRIRGFLARLAANEANDSFEKEEDVARRDKNNNECGGGGGGVNSAKRDVKQPPLPYHNQHLQEHEPLAYDMLCAAYRFQADERRWTWTWANGTTWTNRDPLQTSRVLVRVQLRVAALAQTPAPAAAAEKSNTATNDLNNLSDLQRCYGARLFKCSYSFCASSLRGFETPQGRNEHEMGHGRSWECGEPACPYYQIRFLTRGMRDQHIENTLEFHHEAPQKRRRDGYYSDSRSTSQNQSQNPEELEELDYDEIHSLLRHTILHSDGRDAEALARVQQLCALPQWRGCENIAVPKELQTLVATEKIMPVMAPMIKALDVSGYLDSKVIIAAIRSGNAASARYVLTHTNDDYVPWTLTDGAIEAESDAVYAAWTDVYFDRLVARGVREGFKVGNRSRPVMVSVFSDRRVWNLADKNPLVKRRLLALLDDLKFYWTPEVLGSLLIAVSYGSQSIIFARKLMELGASVNFRDNSRGGGLTPLQVAASSASHKAAVFMKFLLRNGAEVLPLPDGTAMETLTGAAQIENRLNVTWDELVRQQQQLWQQDELVRQRRHLWQQGEPVCQQNQLEQEELVHQQQQLWQQSWDELARQQQQTRQQDGQMDMRDG